MAGSRTSFTKRQKEQARNEKRREKEARKQQRKLEKQTGDAEAGFEIGVNETIDDAPPDNAAAG